ncbi:MAG: roadblock/LC7 domain-containing protein [Candidatus Altiarchaeota archaeon]|nr:roadblock/LC7 domain-containing protein [Candidatus Altiarchaeota archaeon]
MLEKILTDLNSVEGVTGSLVTGKDGLVIAQRAPAGVDVDLASAMTATIFGTGDRAIKELKQGEIVQGMLEGTAGKTLVIAGKDAILMVMTSPRVNLGLVRIEMTRCIKEIEESL